MTNGTERSFWIEEGLNDEHGAHWDTMRSPAEYLTECLDVPSHEVGSSITENRSIEKGDAIYARRYGNTTFAWYVIDRPCERGHIDGVPAMAHRQHSPNQRPKYMVFADIKRHDAGRWA